MPKFYVESGPARLILQAPSARLAAVSAFQWSCVKQSGIQADSALEHLLTAEANGWQLGETVRVSERGFGRGDSQTFDTLQIVRLWQTTPPETIRVRQLDCDS